MPYLTLYASTARPGEYLLVERSTGKIVRGPFEGDPDPSRVMDGLCIEATSPIELELVPDLSLCPSARAPQEGDPERPTV